MKKIQLNKHFYSKEAIEMAKREFLELCYVNVTENEKFYRITLIPKEDDGTNDLARLFANFCLGNMK